MVWHGRTGCGVAWHVEAVTPVMNLQRAEKRWSGRCIISAPGPSLTLEVAEMCRGEIVVAVNDAVRLLPFAKILYSCDAAWWELNKGCPDFKGQRWTSHSLRPRNDKTAIGDRFGLYVIEGEDQLGFSLDPSRICYGNNSGYQAVNLAILFGADPIILTGFDMRAVNGKRHFFGGHKAPLTDVGNFGTWIANFARAAQMLGDRPRIINATPNSGLTCFPMMSLAEALGERIAA